MSDAPATEAPKARVPLEEYSLSLAEREWSILHTGLHLTPADEDHFFQHRMHALPYGVALWSSGIALAYEIAARGAALAGKTVLELGAGIGLPGIVASSFGARVTQTDNQELAMSLCQVNAQRNGVGDIEYGLVDWVAWTEQRRFDYILGADILYGDALHPHLWHIFETNLAPGGRVLLSDPMRGPSKLMFDRFEEHDWAVDVQFLEIGDGDQSRTLSLFDASPPSSQD
jgi:predicted nicotinamide N-methyase